MRMSRLVFVALASLALAACDQPLTPAEAPPDAPAPELEPPESACAPRDAALPSAEDLLVRGVDLGCASCSSCPRPKGCLASISGRSGPTSSARRAGPACWAP